MEGFEVAFGFNLDRETPAQASHSTNTLTNSIMPAGKSTKFLLRTKHDVMFLPISLRLSNVMMRWEELRGRKRRLLRSQISGRPHHLSSLSWPTHLYVAFFLCIMAHCPIREQHEHTDYY